MTSTANSGRTAQLAAVARHSRDQKLRRFLLLPTGWSCIGPEWTSTHIRTPAKITNTDKTATATRSESTGTRTSPFDFEAIMPNCQISFLTQIKQ